jgi:hypothetical protein
MFQTSGHSSALKPAIPCSRKERFFLKGYSKLSGEHTAKLRSRQPDLIPSKLLFNFECEDDRTLDVTLVDPGNSVGVGIRTRFLPFGFLNDPPRSGAIFFVITRPLIHDVRPVFMPSRRTFII